MIIRDGKDITHARVRKKVNPSRIPTIVHESSVTVQTSTMAVF